MTIKEFYRKFNENVDTVNVEGVVWYKADDVYDFLEIDDKSKVVSEIDANNKEKFKLDSYGEFVFLNQDGLDDIIFSVNTPIAREYQRIVVKIMVSIRQKGFYGEI